MAQLKPIDGSAPRQPLERILPAAVVRNLQSIYASEFYGRLSLTFEKGRVTYSKLEITEHHVAGGARSPAVDNPEEEG